MNETELKISGICDDIKDLLIDKNRKYGKLNDMTRDLKKYSFL